MKKLIITLAAVLSLTFVGCQTTSVKGSGIKGKSASVKTGKRAIVDYQGAVFGREIPEWVVLLSEGQYSQEVLSTVMPNLKNKKVFVVQERGDNLDFVKSWSTLVQIETEVSGSLERVTGKVVTSKLEGDAKASGNKADPTEVQKALDDYRIALQDVRIAGLEKIADYWILVEEPKGSGNEYYEYYGVYGMDKKIFEGQLEHSLAHIKETTTEGEALKGIIKDKLANQLSVSSHTPEVADSADEYTLK